MVTGRYFELTIGVHLWEDEELPRTFNEWMERAGFVIPGASPTTLKRVVEVRHPPAPDVIERRREDTRLGHLGMYS